MREGSISRCPLTLSFLVRDLVACFLVLPFFWLVPDLVAVCFLVEETFACLASDFCGVPLEGIEVWAKLAGREGKVGDRLTIKPGIMILTKLLMRVNSGIMGRLVILLPTYLERSILTKEGMARALHLLSSLFRLAWCCLLQLG